MEPTNKDNRRLPGEPERKKTSDSDDGAPATPQRQLPWEFEEVTRRYEKRHDSNSDYGFER